MALAVSPVALIVVGLGINTTLAVNEAPGAAATSLRKDPPNRYSTKFRIQDMLARFEKPGGALRETCGHAAADVLRFPGHLPERGRLTPYRSWPPGARSPQISTACLRTLASLMCETGWALWTVLPVSPAMVSRLVDLPGS